MEATAPAGRTPQLAKYEIFEEIGHGGMATVYRARDKRLGREVAVKVIHPHLRDSREVVSRFNAEARAVAKLRHPNIVEVFDVSEADEVEQYLVVELVRGTTLRKVLQSQGPMPPEIAAAVALELLGALAHAGAAGVVHRDIKPENVLIEHRPLAAGNEGASAAAAGSTGSQPPAGDRVVVKLTDFGIAKLLDAQGVTSTGQVLGSPAHMAPEQIEGGEVDARADIFGLGVLLYECMVGHLPFEGSNPAQVLRRVLDSNYPEAQAERPLIGNRWSALIDRALAHDAVDRFADANAMRDAMVAELNRLGLPSPRREIEAWFDDPAGYRESHAKRTIERLCALAAEARRSGDVLSAAADYNRALAHAPDDPQLLRIVAGMNRAEAHTRVLRRAGVALVLMLGLGAVAFGLGRMLRARALSNRVAIASTVAVAPPPPASLAEAHTPSVERAAPPPPPVPRTPPPAPPPKPVERTFTLDLSPSMGVIVRVDDGSARHVATGDSLVLDNKPHALSFTCEVCTAVRREVGGGERDETLKVDVPIKPATLVIDGEVYKTYQIVQHPEVKVRPGSNTVTLRSAFERVTVQQIETNVTVAVRLEAGNSVHASF
jgi:serine/threonine-protein kinase